MKVEIPIRIVVNHPPEGVRMQVQRGSSELLAPSRETAEALTFDLVVTVDMSADPPNFLGKYAQGPKDARFVYVNSGGYAHQYGTVWNRRAKITLMNISREQLESVVRATGSRLQTEFEGTAKDGGPTCASVKGIEWTVETK